MNGAEYLIQPNRLRIVSARLHPLGQSAKLSLPSRALMKPLKA